MSTPWGIFLRLLDSYVDVAHQINWWLFTEVPGCGASKPVQVRHSLNTHKGLTGVFVLGAMWYYSCNTTAAWAYVGMHGTYGLLWFVKDALYPDKQWDTPATVGSYILMVITIGILGWTSPWLLVKQKNELPAWLLGLNISVFTIGILLHHGADIQKHFTLKLKGGLITDGFFCCCRNPNYLGEMFIYSSFALMSYQSPHWYLPWCYTAFVYAVLFLPNWIRKDRSISRHTGWAQYKARSGLILPWGWWKATATDAAAGTGRGHYERRRSA